MIVFVLIKNYKKKQNKKHSKKRDTATPPMGDGVSTLCSPLALFIINCYKIRNVCDPLKNRITKLTIY